MNIPALAAALAAGTVNSVERVYFQDSLDHIGDSRVFDILASEQELADRIETDFVERGYSVTRQQL